MDFGDEYSVGGSVESRVALQRSKIGRLARTIRLTWTVLLAMMLAAPITRARLETRAFTDPDLFVAPRDVALADTDAATRAKVQWQGFLARYAGPVEVYVDSMSGRPTNVIAPVPLIPGAGVGNAVTLDAIGTRLGRTVDRITTDVVADVFRNFIEDNAALLGIRANELDAIHASPVSDVLWYVKASRKVGRVPVRGSVILGAIKYGNLILFGTERWGDVQVDANPAIDSDAALVAGFEHVGGQTGDDVILAAPRLEIVPVRPASGWEYGHRLVWVFEFRRTGEAPHWEMMIDAGSGRALSLTDQNQQVESYVVGGVYAESDTEICPTDGEGLFDHERCGSMQSGWPMAFTNVGPGNYADSAGAHTATSATTTLQGRYASITDVCGPISIGGAPNLNLGGANGDHDCETPTPASPGNTAAARTVLHSVAQVRQIAKGWLPLNTWLDAPVPITVNECEQPDICSAVPCGGVYFQNGNIALSRSMATEEQNCRNVGENRAIVDHEWGHALDDNDANPVLSNTSESYADITAIYRSQAPCIGYGLLTVDQGCGTVTDGTGYNSSAGDTQTQHCLIECSGRRNADWGQHAHVIPNTPDTPQNFVCPVCLDGPASSPCGKEVHCAGEPITQAAWDLAARDLQAAPYFFDTNTAFTIANKLHYQGSGLVSTWYSCDCNSGSPPPEEPYSSGCGAGGGFFSWLAADDDNGNLNNGTPHQTAIQNAFTRHRIGCQRFTGDSGCTNGPAPQVALSPGADAISVSWGAISGATGYWVLRSEGAFGCEDGKFRRTVSGETTLFADSEVLPNHTYCYSVMAANGSDDCFSRASVCACTTARACTIVPPGGSLTLLQETFSNGIPASWQVVDGGQGGGAAATWTAANPCSGPIASPFANPWAEVDSGCAGPPPTKQNEKLVTPAVAPLGCTRLRLEFDNYFAWTSGGSQEIADVDVSIDGGSTWTNVLRLENGSDGTSAPSHKVLDLTPWTLGAATAKVRFHYTGANDGRWAIDNVRLFCSCSL